MFTVSASVEDFLQIITALSDATGMEGGEFTPGPGSDLGETSNNSLLKPELSPDLTPGLGQNQALQCTWNGVTFSRAKEPPAVHNSVQGLAVTWERLATTGCYLVSQYPPTSTDIQSGAAGLATVQQPGDQMNTGQAEL